jgi:predicted DNA-binding transcriptional regulator YafY
MVQLTKKEAQEIAQELSKSKNKKTRNLIKKLTSPIKAVRYVYDKKEILTLLNRAFKERRNVKIEYYSLSSDEITRRAISIYEIREAGIIAFCHLRKEERVFNIQRIGAAKLLDEKYSIPKGWSPKSRILN